MENNHKIIEEIDTINKSLKELTLSFDEMKRNIERNVIDRNEILKDLIIDLIINKKQDITPLKTVNRRDTNDNIIIDKYYKNIIEYLEKNKIDYKNIIISKNTDKRDDITDELTLATKKNIKNCFIWNYSHISEIRTNTLKLTNVENYVIELYNNKEDINKHNKGNLTELLKYEGNEIYKKFKEETYFKNYCQKIKMENNE